MLNRISRVQESLKEQNLNAIFISNQYNVTYLTGFDGLSPNEREGFLLVTRQNAYLLTFPTYFGMYKNGGNGFSTLCITQSSRITSHLSDICSREHITSIGFEPDNLTVSELLSLETKLNIKLTTCKNIVEDQRIIKEDTELKSIRKSCAVTDQAFDFIRGEINAGVTEKELAFKLEFFIKSKADDIAFPPIVAFDQNAAIPHYLPSNNQKLLINNNLILLDFGAQVDGYCSDMTRVVFFKSVSNENLLLYQTVLDAQKIALHAIAPGKTGAHIDTIARDHIKSKGYPEFPHGLGHGVGLAIHEAPRLRYDAVDILKEHMVVTVEPGIYLEGKSGIRIEDLVVLTHDGCEVLSKSSKEVAIL